MTSLIDDQFDVLLDEDPVDEDEGEGHDEKDVGEVEDELRDEVFGAVPFHVPMRYSNLETDSKYVKSLSVITNSRGHIFKTF
jgi:hypothetical protein